MSCSVINHIPNIESYSYLELGIGNSINFNEIKCSKKFSVDINGSAMFNGTTDEFFKQIDSDSKFDIIFIDANHDFEYVLRDFNNAIDHATKWIVLHDMIPPNQGYTSSSFCSDSFRILFHILRETSFTVYPMNENFGLTLVKIPASKISILPYYETASFSEFETFIKTVKLYSREEMEKILKSEG